MDLRQLRYFVTVAELGSFTAAASRLNIVQSALSRQIANLEVDLGVTLFYREGRRIRLAPAGERLARAAQKILIDVQQLRATVREANDEIAGTVGFGAHPSDGDVILPRLFHRIDADFPGIRLDPVQALTAELQELLLKGRLDMAILTFPDALPGIDIDPLAREHVYFAGRAEDFPIEGDTVPMRDALRHPMVISHRPSRERSGLEATARRFDVEMTVAVEADGLPLMKMLAQQGRGYLMLPETALYMEKDDPSWRVVRIEDYQLVRFLARRSTQVPSKAASAVYDILMSEIEALKAQGMMH